MSENYKKLEKALEKNLLLFSDGQYVSDLFHDVKSYSVSSQKEPLTYEKLIAGSRNLAAQLRGSEKFVMCEDFEDMDEWNHYWDEMCASALALREAGLFHLPYPASYFESKFIETILPNKGGWKSAQIPIEGEFFTSGEWKKLLPVKDTGNYPIYSPHKHSELFCCLAIEDVTVEQIKIAPFFHLFNDPKNHFTHYWKEIIINTNPNEPLTPGYAGVFHNLGLTPTPDEVWSVTEEQRAIARHVAIERLVISTLVLLNTKWAKKQRVFPLEMRMKPQLLKRAKPTDGHTTVTIRPPKSEEVEGNGKPRHRVRLHLRRGHNRHQPWGLGRQLSKLIWIEPTLVGYEEEGVITHDEYRVKHDSRS